MWERHPADETYGGIKHPMLSNTEVGTQYVEQVTDFVDYESLAAMSLSWLHVHSPLLVYVDSRAASALLFPGPLHQLRPRIPAPPAHPCPKPLLLLRTHLAPSVREPKHQQRTPASSADTPGSAHKTHPAAHPLHRLRLPLEALPVLTTEHAKYFVPPRTHAFYFFAAAKRPPTGGLFP